jgi:hypothetical protein
MNNKRKGKTMTKHYNPCEGCSGEDCVCCEVYLENRENQLHQPGPDELEEELREYEDPEATEAGQRRLDNLRSDYENDTPMGQAYADGFDDGGN